MERVNRRRTGRAWSTLTAAAAALVVCCAALGLAAGPAVAGTFGRGAMATPPANSASNFSASTLHSVSCASAGNCVAVGLFTHASDQLRGLLVTQSTGAWAAGTEAALPANALTTAPKTVVGSASCPSAGNCTAVGTYLDTSGYTQGLLAGQSAGAWAPAIELTLPANASLTNPKVTLGSVSCASVGNCAALGTYVDTSGSTQGLLAGQSAGAWAPAIAVTLPANASLTNPKVTLGSVSCASAGNCAAVGSYTDAANGVRGLLLTQSAGTWAIGLEAPLPADASTTDPGVSLNSVACASAGNCAAVGKYFDAEGIATHGLVLSEASGVWAAGIQPALPANAATNHVAGLYSVSCPSAGNCAAVGSYRDSSDRSQGLLVNQSSGTWAAGTAATPPAGAASNPKVTLDSVSCASVGNCTASGSYDDGAGHTQGLLLSDSAGVWATGTTSPVPAGAATDPRVELGSVSCASAGNCTVAGSYFSESGLGQGLVLSESSGVWSSATTPSVPSAAATKPNVLLGSVSCASVGNCAAVGAYSDISNNVEGVLMDESAGVWAPGIAAGLPAGASAAQFAGLASVSCTSVGNCAAVGVYLDGADHPQGLLVNESSGVWGAGLKATLPAGAAANANLVFGSVSCSSKGNCAAVGTYLDAGDNTQGLLLSEVSGVWGPGVKATLPGDAATNPSVQLPSVSCAPAGGCTAVGIYQDSLSRAHAVILRETSGVWAPGIQPALPANAGTSAGLLSVSCPSAGNCAAVGLYVDDTPGIQGLLVSESSGVWGTGVEAALPADAAPNPNVLMGSVLCLSSGNCRSVSCASAGNCAAVGTYVDGAGHTKELLLSQSSGVWASGSAATLPADAAANPNLLPGAVSCGAPGDCAAVATYRDGAGSTQGLSLSSSSGTWAPGTQVRLPAGAAPNPEVRLATVSCAAAGGCAAVGSYVDGSGAIQGLLLGPPAAPALSVSAPASGGVGDSIAASSLSASLSAGAAPTGTITFTVFGPQSSPPDSCGSGGTTFATAIATGNGTYAPSAGFTPSRAGDYWWYAGYAGDADNKAAGSACGAAMAKTTVSGPAPAGPAGAIAPVNTAAPAITGTALPGHAVTCSPGAWANAPTSFGYRWSRGGVPIAGATDATYRVGIGDEATSPQSLLACTVTAVNAAGAVAATSAGVLVALPGTLSCKVATGSLSATKLGPLSLHMTKAAARARIRRYTATRNNFDDFCLYGGWGIRAGYPSRSLLRRLHGRARKQATGRIVLALTSNPSFNLRTVKPGASLASAKRALKLPKPLRIAGDDWYITADKRANGVLKVKGGVVQEVGIADRALSTGRAAQRRLLSSFKGI